MKTEKIRYRILAKFSREEKEFFSEVYLRTEFVDPPNEWKLSFTTEGYTYSEGSIKRARLWIEENYPNAIE